MKTSAIVYQLSVRQVQQSCWFELTWGEGQRLQATLEMPMVLLQTYQQWQQAYLDYYRRMHLLLDELPPPQLFMRGRAAGSGTVNPPTIDWGKRLSDRERDLLEQFCQWLSHTDALDNLRREIVGAGRTAVTPNDSVDLLITCDPIDLARLPWEAWDIADDLAIGSKIRISRSAPNIRQPAAPVQRMIRRRPRLLVILGDDRGLNFAIEIDALQKRLRPFADLVFVGYRSAERIDDLKNQIVQAIDDRRGWDVLLFAGHSNETGSGELSIAPGVSIEIHDIAPQLIRAKDRGLQFAMFNSCQGLSIANSLLDLGLSQVAVMREPIENRVAQEFLVRFVQGLAEHKDVHEAMIAARQHLETDKKLAYPSAYLIPSLFRHPDTTLFHLPPKGLRYWLKPWASKPYEVAALALLTLCSVLPPLQLALLEQRVLTQAYYRQLTQRDTIAQQPPLTLVQINEESLRRADLIGREYPIPQGYLADLIDRLSSQGTKIIAIDYLLDPLQPATPRLAQAIQRAGQRGTKFIFATTYDNDGKWHTARPELLNAAPSLQGNAEGSWGDDYRIPLFDRQNPQPFPLLADLLANTHQQQNTRESLPFSDRNTLSPITNFSYFFGQYWLHPIADFSLRPDQVYQAVPAWQILEPSSDSPNGLQQTVLIASGGYATAGWRPGDDSFPAPAAIMHWYLMENSSNAARLMTGGEHLAYLFHHFLSRKFVLPIPDLWMILLAAVMGKGIALLLQEPIASFSKLWISQRTLAVVLLCSGTIFYTLLSLELYLSSAAILLPIVLPAVTVWVYVLPACLKLKSR
ncbi:CHASE2 domain-containing protein [Leptolyngbya ohadii]|uniref:CHASE2 domain-containing protein n=1 Tax=Leptolyngbya ohadii TaxID=1962290 RepID=UPI000B5991D9|nr:CHASE2 domain-containing protein [Leptolyngbya ohadii]